MDCSCQSALHRDARLADEPALSPILVVGGSGSGKSALAETLAVRLAGSAAAQMPLYYLATMQVGRDPENRERVRKHRLQRAGAGFITLETPLGLGSALSGGLIPDGRSVVLLEDLSNLAANEMFMPAGVGPAKARERIESDLLALFACVRHVVVVSNDIFADAMHYDDLTGQYLAVLGQLNRFVAARAGGVVEAVCGLPLIHRDTRGEIGEWLCCGSLKN